MIKSFDITKFTKWCLLVVVALTINITSVNTASSMILLTPSVGITAATAKAVSSDTKAELSDLEKCSPRNKYESQLTCTLCGLFKVVFNTVSAVGDRSANNFSDSIVKLVIAGFAVWLAVETMKFVSSYKARDLKDYAQTLIIQSFKVLLAILILKAGIGEFYNVFISPVYKTSLNMSNTMMRTDKSAVEEKTEAEAIAEAIKNIKIYTNGLPQEMGISIVRTMTQMENRVRQVTTLGRSIMCYSWADVNRWFIFPKIGTMLVGLAIWVLGTSMLIIIPFLMIDAVFHLGVATALMPFAVGAFPFNYTRKKLVSKVWDTFLVSAFTFLFISVIVLILLGAVEVSISSSLTGSFQKMFTTDTTDQIFLTLFNELSLFSPAMLKLLFVFTLSWSVMGMGKKMAEEFGSSLGSGGGKSGIGSSIGTMALSTAKGAALKAGKPLGKGLKYAGSAVGGYAANTVRRGGVAISNKIANKAFDRKMNRNQANVKTGPNGEQIFTDRKGNTYIRDAGGNITTVKNSTSRKINGTKEITTEREIRTKNGIIITGEVKIMKRNANGEWEQIGTRAIPERIKSANSEAANPFNEDGTYNPKAMAALLEGTSGETREAIKKVMDRAILEQRFSEKSFNLEKMNLAQDAEVSEDPATGERTTKYVTKDGKVIITKIKMRSDGLIETTLTEIDADGRVATLESDGIRNKESIKILNKGVDATKLNNMDDILANCKTDEFGRFIGRTSYGYTDYYAKLIEMGADPDKFSVGMFYDDVKPQYDADGNISGSNFDRYMHEAAHNRSFRNEEGYSREDQIILNRGEIFRVGNSYDAQEAAMRNNFTHSDNKYQRRRDIWT